MPAREEFFGLRLKRYGTTCGCDEAAPNLRMEMPIEALAVGDFLLETKFTIISRFSIVILFLFIYIFSLDGSSIPFLELCSK
jgi:hypothetical protein